MLFTWNPFKVVPIGLKSPFFAEKEMTSSLDLPCLPTDGLSGLFDLFG